MKYTSTLKSSLIYIFRINKSQQHEGCLKIGETTIENGGYENLQPNCKELQEAAHKRIGDITRTAGVEYELLHAECAAYKMKGEVRVVSDHMVRDVLYNSGLKKKIFQMKQKPNEWVITDLETAKKAINAAKEGRFSLSSNQISSNRNPVIFRDEQKEAIEKAIKQFKKNNVMLWYAKMRFGKTLCALEVVKRLKFKRTLILTHRPVVKEGWGEDFNKIFYDQKKYYYGFRKKSGDKSFELIENKAKKDGSSYVYFASMHDLRGSSKVGGNFDKNDEIFKAKWDLIIIDEAHEGTQTELGRNVMAALKKLNTKELHLSGTPFNLLDNYKESEIFTWDYVMEQRAKENWEETNWGDPNPYKGLPKMNIYTYDLGKLLSKFTSEDMAFNFREFFRVDSKNNSFIHEKDVSSFLNLMCKKDSGSNYPFSTTEYKNNFRHTLWLLPGVKEAKALSSLLKKHPVFGQFNIANVAGDGDEEEKYDDALEKVKNAITEKPNNAYSITLSCGRLTTGVSVPAWTAVFMLSGSNSTSASSYMQTIFRVQTPATINGKIKTDCYVFDFAPDRALKVVAETAKISAKAGKTTDLDRVIMGKFLNFCPIIGIDGSKLSKYDVDSMLAQLKRVYVERVVKSGFEDMKLYNTVQLMQLKELELKDFKNLEKIIGTTKAQPKTGEIEINKQGFTNEEYELIEQIEIKIRKRQKLTAAEIKLYEERKEKKKQRDTAVSILRGISIRMPLLLYGADLNNENQQITLDNFASLIDEQSWEEYMPKGVTKAVFEKFKRYYDKDIFQAAGKRIRDLARAADAFSIEERIEHITNIFSTFRNPDKETVLTPWRVVNMHMSDCLGGYVFYDDKFEKPLAKPRFVNHGLVTKEVFKEDTRILEINSKSGLYPLFMAYGVYRSKLASAISKGKKSLEIKEQQKLWDKVIAENIFVICKTPMAKSITKRTLVGFREDRTNSKFYENLVPEITTNQKKFTNTIIKGKTFWKSNNIDNMKFNAIVGNPPYQEMDGGNSVSAKPIYNYFVDIAKHINPDYFSMIMPARWYAGGKGLDNFRKSMLNDIRIAALFDFPNSNDCFTNVDVAGGLCYFLWDRNYSGACSITNYMRGEVNVVKRKLNEFEILIRDNKAIEILRKIMDLNKELPTLAERVSSRKPFGLPTNYEPRKKGVSCWFVQKIGLGFADERDITDVNKTLNKWKLLLPKSPIAGQTDFTKAVGFYYDGNTIVARPGECCTESFIVAGSFDTEQEVKFFKSYLFTKTVRFILLQNVVSQDVTKKNFGLIPDLLRYDKIITDKQLCKLWKIDEAEWSYIDKRIADIK